MFIKIHDGPTTLNLVHVVAEKYNDDILCQSLWVETFYVNLCEYKPNTVDQVEPMCLLRDFLMSTSIMWFSWTTGKL